MALTALPAGDGSSYVSTQNSSQIRTDPHAQIVEGVATCGWSIVSAFLLLDFPATSRKLSDRERALAVHRLTSENVGAETEDEVHLSPLQALLEAIRNWRTWMMVVGYMVLHTLSFTH